MTALTRRAPVPARIDVAGLVAECSLLAATVIFAVVTTAWSESSVVAAVVLTPLLVLLRHRAPITALLAATGLHVLDVVPAVIPLLCFSAGYRTAKATRLWLAVGAVLLATTVRFDAAQIWWGLAMYCGAALAGSHIRQRGERTELLVRQARLRERNRIARDMHDSLGYQLSLISIQAGALQVDRTLSPEHREAVARVGEATRRAATELADVIGMLRPGQEPDSCANRDIGGIDDLVEAHNAELVTEGEPLPLAAASAHTAYRVVQEGLTNAAKHAPGAAVEVRLTYRDDGLAVQVRSGSPPVARYSTGSGQGLAGLRERVELVGGVFSAGRDRDGFLLAAVLPYRVGDAPATAEPAPHRQKPLVAAASVVGVMALLVAVIVMAQLRHWGEVPAAVIAELRAGQAENDVMARLPERQSLLADTGASVPDRATCRYYHGEESGRIIPYRLCFRDGALLEGTRP
ncbi:sensor histidine kinase [Allokutzneria oryzae]|uniref:histidine kinase n=1 Tax=Allokutzneria oryzae TaxID=1378989 RepID=A0ABV6A0J6_9PSEU